MLNGWKGTKKDKQKKRKNVVHKYNFENATEKNIADKEFGYITIPECDGQVKHPEHLQQHEMLQVLQRHALNEKWGTVKHMIKSLPEHQRKDTINMLKKTNNDLGKKFPDGAWFFQNNKAMGIT
jgi:hypothetical protein